MRARPRANASTIAHYLRLGKFMVEITTRRLHFFFLPSSESRAVHAVVRETLIYPSTVKEFVRKPSDNCERQKLESLHYLFSHSVIVLYMLL